MNNLETAIYQKLIGDTTLTALLADGSASVFNHESTPGADYPLVVFQYQGGGDENKSPHRSKNLVYTIKAVSNVSLVEAGTIDAVIDTLFHLQEIDVTGWENFWLAREGEIRLVETTPEGVKYYHAGAMYRIRIAK